MPAIDMTEWSSLIVERFKILLNIREIGDEISDDGAGGDGDEAKLKRVAITRNRNPLDVRTAHDTLAVLAFSGYQDWCQYDDDDWTKNCLSQVFDDRQSFALVSALQEADLIGLSTIVRLMAGEYRDLWQQAADADAARPAGITAWPTPGLVISLCSPWSPSLKLLACPGT